MGAARPNAFTWILLSDIHHGDGDHASMQERKHVLERLRKDLFPNTLWPAPDAILVTGDIAAKGGSKRGEYEEAKAFLEGLRTANNLGKRSIFLVPGNHDVDRTVDRNKDVRRLIGSLRAGSEKLDEVLASSEVKRVHRRQKPFWDFHATFHNRDPYLKRDPCGLYWSARLPLRSFSVNLVGLNSALLAADNEDEHKLSLGHTQLGFLSDRSRSGPAVNILLTHHPIGWLRPEEQVFDGAIRRVCQLHLTGHVHDADTYAKRRAGQSPVISVVSGAVHEVIPGRSSARRLTHFRYSICRLEYRNRTVVFTQWPRLWSVGRGIL